MLNVLDSGNLYISIKMSQPKEFLRINTKAKNFKDKKHKENSKKEYPNFFAILLIFKIYNFSVFLLK